MSKPISITAILYLGVIVTIVSAAMLLLTGMCARAQEDVIDVDTIIVFLADVSGSIDDKERALIRDAHVYAVTHPDFISAVQAGILGRVAVIYVEFATSAAPVSDYTVIATPADARAFARTIGGKQPPVVYPGNTHINGALLTAAAILDASPYRATREVVDIVGDGIDSVYRLEAMPARALLLARGVTINAMALLRTPSEFSVGEYYATMIVGGPGHFAMPVDGIGQLPALLRRKLILELF
jgi:hypothetical protein